MRHCAFLTMDNLDGFVSDDELLYEPLARLGWRVHPVSWRKDVDWNIFEAVIIRTPWDYHKDPESFLNTLENIERSSARLANPLELVRWNVRKTYLFDLERRGIEIVPTLVSEQLEDSVFTRAYGHFEAEEIVVKPVVGASADDTFRVHQDSDDSFLRQIGELFVDRHVLVQPFMKGIVQEGEFSLFYFGGLFSHGILKTPKPNDFRSQEEHGGVITAVRPETELLAAGDRVVSLISPSPLYLRVDLVRTDCNTFAVMELELIEPALYFRMDGESPMRFARAFVEWMKNSL